jgi:hypothetical protein
VSRVPDDLELELRTPVLLGAFRQSGAESYVWSGAIAGRD